jgi:hypothetical protein
MKDRIISDRARAVIAHYSYHTFDRTNILDRDVTGQMITRSDVAKLMRVWKYTRFAKVLTKTS